MTERDMIVRIGSAAPEGDAVLPPPPDTLPPDADALPALLAGALDDRDLHIVAAADYGHTADENLAALRRLVREGTLAPLEWRPREMFELTRWDEPLHDPLQDPL